jgi:hypothetical protein
MDAAVAARVLSSTFTKLRLALVSIKTRSGAL